MSHAATASPPARLNVGPRTAEELAAFEHELDTLRERTRAKVGAADARYIRRVLWSVRLLELAGRALLLAGGWFWPTWWLGSVCLGLAKILDNMELGHNVMHGQFNFMNDPRFSGHDFDWDNTCPKEEWRHSHNFVHHHYTNVWGMDRDFGYGLLRLSSDLRWTPQFLTQPLRALLLALYFEWFVAVHDMQLDKILIKRKKWSDVRPQWLLVRAKMGRQALKDYVAWPLVAAAVGWAMGDALAWAGAVLVGNIVGNLIRNVWAFAIIFCGHFTEGIHTFDKSCLAGETRGQWYLRQILGSSNLRGSRLLHIMSGNLSHQIEHHLFPDLPATRYAELAPQVQAICRKYGVPYNTGSFVRQFGTVLLRIARYSFPGGPQKAVTLALPAQAASGSASRPEAAA